MAYRFADSPLLATLEKLCLQQGVDSTYWVAYSGGLDSHVLLHLLIRLRSFYPLKLHVLHINHSLSANASSWTKHCEAICGDLQVDFTVQIIDAKADTGDSPEEIARERRYAVFAGRLKQNDLLLTAHHQDDQAETLLLQLIRGAGPKGLAAMPVCKKLGLGFQVRPLLSFSRQDLQTYAQENNLQWIEDESNVNTNFSRNFVRHDIMPLLAKRWPQVAATFSRSALHCAEAQQLLEEMAQQDWVATKGSVDGTLLVSRLLALSFARQRQLIRYWLQQKNYALPGKLKMQHILQDMLLAAEDKTPCVTWKNIELRRYQDDLYAMQSLPAHDQGQIIPWDQQADLKINSRGILRASLTDGCGLRTNLSDITIRFRQGGEVCQLPNRSNHHSLKNLLWEWNILPWERDRIPLIYVADKLAAIAGYFIADEFAASQNEQGYVFSFEKF
jgi:tRNA(Ile)-lysidine synthase